MSVWRWAGVIAASWFTASILLAGVWTSVGRRIFRKSPAEQHEQDAAEVQYLAAWRRGER